MPPLGTSKQSTLSIPAVISVKVTDPTMHRFMEIAHQVDISASGTLKTGSYVVKGKTVSIRKPTQFRLDMSMPIDDPNAITTAKASGTLWTSEDITFAGVPLPRTIMLKNGKATSDVDLLRLLGTYFINVLHNQIESESANNKEIRQIVESLTVKSAAMQLKPDSFLKLDEKQLHIGKDSKIELTDVTIDSDLNYKATCVATLNFANNCRWIGDKVDCLFNGGSARLKLAASRLSGNVQLSLDEAIASGKAAERTITLTDCTFKFGKEKQSSAHSATCLIKPTTLTWQKTEGDTDSTLHLSTPMNLTGTRVAIKTKSQETDAEFPDLIPANLSVDITPVGRETKFATTNPETASKATIHIHRPKTKILLTLSEATVDKISFDKHGDLDFNITQGSARLDQIDWSAGSKNFKLTTKGKATLSLPSGMNLSLNRERHETQMVLPVTVRLGEATFAGSAGTLQLSDVNGSLLIVLDPDIHITSEMQFNIDHSRLLGSEQAFLKAKGLDISSVNGQARAHIKNCTVTLSQEVLRNAIIQRLPKQKVFTLNKVVADRKWRYRNATVNTVTMKNLQIDRMSMNDKNTFDFTCTADLQAEGTIDKGGLMATFKENAKTATHPWSASAVVVGKGTLDYSLIPNASLAMSELSYKLDADVAFDDDVKLDWSKVSGGLVELAEKGVIVSHLKKLDLPLDFDGRLKMFKDHPDKLKVLKLTKFTVVPSGSSAEISFTADAVL